MIDGKIAIVLPSRTHESSTAKVDPAEVPFRYLYRPVIFRQPDRVTHPPSWLEHIPFAFWIVDVLRPQVIVELGTQSGNSYAAFAQAVQMTNLAARTYAVDTWKGDAHAGFYDEAVFTEFAAYHGAHFSSFSRLIRSTFEEAAAYFADGDIDLLHLDGCHTYEAVQADFNLWRDKISGRGVVLMHDTNVREREFGVWRLWSELSARYPSFEFLHGHGLGVLAIGSDVPDAVRWLVATRTTEEVRAIRECFAHLGRAISAPFTAAVMERTRSQELQARAETVGQLTGEIADLRKAQEGSSAERQERESTLTRKDEVIRSLEQRVAEAGHQLQEALGQRDAALADRDEALRAQVQVAEALQVRLQRGVPSTATDRGRARRPRERLRAPSAEDRDQERHQAPRRGSAKEAQVGPTARAPSEM